MTLTCVRSLRGLAYSNYHIVVVDGGSADNSSDILARELPDVTLLTINENRGYAGGNNVGIRWALANGASYVHIVNPDTTLESCDYLTRLVEHMESNPRVGVIGPKVFLRQNGVRQNTILKFPSLKGCIVGNLADALHIRIRLRSDEPVEVEALNGVCILFRSECLRDIGLFDERLFMYLEEVELQYRSNQRGWISQYLPVNSIVHHQSETGYNMTGNIGFLLKRNTAYFLDKIGKRSEAMGYAILSIGLLLARSITASGIENESRRDYVKFTMALARAYLTIFARRDPDERYGPPYCSWENLRHMLRGQRASVP